MQSNNQDPIYAIDPGTSESAILLFDGEKVISCEIIPNEALLSNLRDHDATVFRPIAIEMIASYGMAVGREVFETCVLIGRILEIAHSKAMPAQLVYRKDVKIHLCGTMKAKDPNIRQALIDKHGPTGTKKNPGKLFGISSHLWSALAVADYAIANPNFKNQSTK